MQGPLAEGHPLRGTLRLRVPLLRCQGHVVVGILGQGAAVLRRVQGSPPLDELVVGPLVTLPKGLDLGVRRVLQLGPVVVGQSRLQIHERPHPVQRLALQGDRLDQARLGVNLDQLALHDAERSWLHAGRRRHQRRRPDPLRGPMGRLGQRIGRQRREGLPKRLLQVAAVGLDDVLVAGVEAPACGRRAQDALGMAEEVFVHRVVEAADGGPSRRFPRFARWLLAGPALPQHQDVRHDPGAGAFLRATGQAHGQEQIGSAGEVGSRLGVLAVHRPAGGDEHHDAARPHLIESLGEEVVVDALRHAGAPIAGVGDRIVAEGHVADGEVIEVVRHVQLLEAHHTHVGPRIQQAQDTATDGVELDRREPGLAGDGLGHEAEEVADASRRLQDEPALEAHPQHRVPHSSDLGRRGVVGVERRATSRVPLVVGQKGAQLLALLRPFGVALVEHLGQGAPTRETREDGLLLGGGRPSFRFELLQEPDRRDVAAELILGASGL